ncbi:MAG: 30S ribosome-binding factor RbfA [Coriobacteriia bacterium]|nr:30S ribosome-binding factor RbfA [Coriobacteriia bacterium]
MKQTPRTRKLNETLREVLARILADEVSDPRLEFVTVTVVRIAPDLMVADVFVTAHGDEERYAEVLAGLESAKGRIRSLLGRRVRLRFTPELRFKIDDSVDESMRITEALKNVPPSLVDHEDAEERDDR